MFYRVVTWGAYAGAAAIIMMAAATSAAQGYVGAQRCGKCHEFEMQMWSRGPHARAHKALSDEEHNDPKCNTCHTSQASALSAVGAHSAAASDESIGIGCEQCHGPGRYYQPTYVMRDQELARALGLIDVGPVHCRRCHNEATPSIESFDFDTMWARIDHGADAKAAWLAAQAKAEQQ